MANEFVSREWPLNAFRIFTLTRSFSIGYGISLCIVNGL